MTTSKVVGPAGEDAALRFQRALAKEFLTQQGVSIKTQFGSPGLLVQGKVFTFPWKGNVVSKLPEARVAALLAAGHGELFNPGHGRASKTWIAVYPGAKRQWRKLALEAKAFVVSQAR